jgi:hypothetical protein
MTTAECREQLERHLQKFREVADERMAEKVISFNLFYSIEIFGLQSGDAIFRQ